ncbi:hypothetical protein GQ42DRAFT_177845 [Ramicandelaber brevisporus]|nr:hypothetical protein GQ42DRAFT_177845 [Ramicandelaber brevisporus]
MSCFRLFGLPLDLLELLTLYFEGKEAVKLLTVSSNFHEIFARSVWHTITVNTIRVPEPTRSSVFARYGHLVRSINLFNKLNSEFHLHNWAQLFPNTTSMVFEITPRMEDGDKQMLMDTIASLHGLRSLKIQMKINPLPFDLERLATVLVVRQRDPSKQSLRELIMFFGLKEDREEQDDDAEEISWFRLSSFVQALSPLRPLIKLQIDMRGYPDLAAPTPVQMAILRPHLSGIPAFSEIEAQDGCTALRNRQLFSPSGTRDDPLVFGQLDTLRLRVCCASSHLFDYSDFTQAKFPVMDSMVITGNECSHQFEDGWVNSQHSG